MPDSIHLKDLTEFSGAFPVILSESNPIWQRCQIRWVLTG